MVSRKGGIFQAEEHCEGTGQQCRNERQQTKWAEDTCRQGESAVLAAFLRKPFFFPHHQSLFLSLSLTVLPFPPPYFHLQCPFSCCFFFFFFIFPIGSFPLTLTLLCQSSSWERHFFCCFHTPLSPPVCHTLVPCPPPPGDLNVSGAVTTWKPRSLSPLCNGAPVLANFILATILINVTNRNSTVMSSRRDWWNNCVK